MINPDKKVNYTNAELAQAYFEVIAQGVGNFLYKKYQEDRENIAAVEGKIQAYFEMHGDLSNLDINKIKKTGRIGRKKRKILESILVKGKEAVKTDLQNQRIGFDASRKI